MTLKNRVGLTGLGFVIALSMSGCASPYPALNAFADGGERGAAGSIIERAFTEPMPSLAWQAQSGGYKNKLAYADALRFGRTNDSPGTDLSTVQPFNDDASPALPPGVDDIYVKASPEGKQQLMAWSRNLANRLLTCGAACGVSQGTADGSGGRETVGQFDSYVISNHARCVSAIVSDYKRHIVLDVLAEAFSQSTGKKQALAHHLLVDYKLTAMLGGGIMFDCDGNFEKYMMLYGALNPKLKQGMAAYLDQELTEKAAIWSF